MHLVMLRLLERGVTNMATVTSDIDSSPTIYVDNDAPSGGVTGDIWLEY